MNKEELQHHLNLILDNINSTWKTVEHMSYNGFLRDETAKEMVYSYLQEMGQAAFHIRNDGDHLLDTEFNLDTLAAFRNARFNQEAEMDHHPVWRFVKNEMREIGDQIEASPSYLPI
ncbi:MAG TPA: hypothetical protein DDY13_13565 [Cytophagales bacterium]|jgi:uncharacterized protein with HEPN domain|nr:hypothetical protein [Cytophagales bacterium]